MATFGFHKDVDDIEEGVPMDEDWYEAEVADEPKLMPNNAIKEVLGSDVTADDDRIDDLLRTNEKAGINLVIPLKIVSDLPEFDGRTQRLFLQYPSEYDEDRYDGIGQKKYDSKMANIALFASKFGGSVDGDSVTILPGNKGMVYVTLGESRQNPGQKINSVDPFAGFKSLDEADEED